MTSEELRQRQPVVFQVLSNSLKKGRLSNAYLFSGDVSACKKEAARLFAKSILCQHPDHDGFACNTCRSCTLFEAGTNPDLFELEQKTVRKADILSLQEHFFNTTLSEKGQRIYIIDHFEQARTEAANALLKFLEEPQPGIHAILISDSRQSVLPTILSRSQAIAFKPETRLQAQSELQNILDAADTNMLAACGYSLEQVEKWNEAFPDLLSKIKKAAWAYIQHPEKDERIFELMELFAPKKETSAKEFMTLFLQYLLWFLKSGQISLPKKARILLQIQITQAMDLLKKNVDAFLVLDDMYYKNRKAMME